MTDQSLASFYCGDVNFKWNEIQTAILLAILIMLLMPAEHEGSVSITTGPQWHTSLKEVILSIFCTIDNDVRLNVNQIPYMVVQYDMYTNLFIF